MPLEIIVSGCSAARLAHLLWEQGVPGSNPGIPTQTRVDNGRQGERYGDTFCSGCSAVRLARQLRELEAPGSNPGIPTYFQDAEQMTTGHLFLFYLVAKCASPQPPNKTNAYGVLCIVVPGITHIKSG